MKKTLLVMLALITLAGCSSADTASGSTASAAASTAAAAASEPATEETATAAPAASASAESVDAVSSASVTHTDLSGSDYDAAISELESLSNDLATKADSEAEGYTAPESTTFAEVISVSPDGYPSMSTIHAWKVDGDTITVVMTDGRTISNLINVGDRGTILIHGSSYYVLHVETSDVKTLEYSDDAYNNGEFNVDYSGADRQAPEYTVTFKINELESTQVYMFD